LLQKPDILEEIRESHINFSERSDMMGMINLCCPYCGKRFDVEPPAEKGYEKPTEEPVYCLPYTRDIGKFDPKPEYDIRSSDCWSSKRIGKDYLSFINFERFGILRVDRKGVNVRYRVQKCIECENLFDVFVNYTKNERLEKIWDHLLEKDRISNGIKLYKGENLAIWLVRTVGSLTNSNVVGVFIFGLVIFILGWLPYTVMNQTGVLNFRLSHFVSDLIQSLMNSLFLDFRLNDPAVILRISTFVLYFSISLGIVLLLLFFEKYISFLRNTTEFDDLFHVTEPKVGVIFWKNYISARFVGVQKKQKFFPQATQSDIFAGGISLILALMSWVKFQAPDFIYSITVRDFQLSLFYIVELIVWLVIIYFLSIAIYLSLSLTSYVLNGIRKIPMNISPFDNFSSSKSLRILESYAVNIMLIAFVIIIITLSFLQMIVQIPWVTIWFELALAFLFIAMGLGANRNEYIVGALLYLFLLYNLGTATLQIDSLNILIEGGKIIQNDNNLQIQIIDLRIMVLGFFLTSALGFQLYLATQYIDGILLNSKAMAIKAQKKQLEILQKNLDFFNEKLSNQTLTLDMQQNEYQSQRASVLSSIETTINIINHLEKVEIKRNPFKQITKTLTPLMTSFILPVFMDITKELVKNEFIARLS
jgi:hypothetical protein